MRGAGGCRAGVFYFAETFTDNRFLIVHRAAGEKP